MESSGFHGKCDKTPLPVDACQSLKIARHPKDCASQISGQRWALASERGERTGVNRNGQNRGGRFGETASGPVLTLQESFPDMWHKVTTKLCDPVIGRLMTWEREGSYSHVLDCRS